MKDPLSTEQRVSEAIKRQAEKVMPLIGPLLDAWDGLPNDVSCSEDLSEFAKHIRRISRAMGS